MLEETSKACVIHATENGKSYISRYLMEKYNHLRIGYFAQSDYILNQMKEMLNESGYDMDNVQMMTYISLANSVVRDKNEMKFDFAIFDEFHRCVAAYWGKGVEKLLEINSNAKIFGTTATPIRTLDNERDMSDELFEGNIASILTLSDAIERGILPNPKYVVALYTYLDELNSLKEKVSKIEDKKRRILLDEKVTKLIEKVENAKGLERIFEENIEDKSSKCIVFTKSIEHLERVKDELVEKLKGVNEQIHIYVVHSKNKNSAKELEKFKADNSDALKLLLTVDMINEGMHRLGVKVVILMRPTKSVIVYNQQMGRASKTREGYKDVNLGEFFKSIKKGNTKISQDDRDLLKSIGYILKSKNVKESVHDKVMILVEFYNKYKREPSREEEYKEAKIGVFLRSIRQSKTKILEEDRELLKSVGCQL